MAKLVFDEPGTKQLSFDEDEVKIPEVVDSPPSTLEAIGRGGAQGLTLGFGDEISGGVRATIDRLMNGPRESVVLEPSFIDKYKEFRDESRAANEAAEEAHPLAYGGTRFVGAVAPAVAATVATKGAAAPVALRALAPTGIKGLAALAATEGVGYSEADLTEGEVRDLARDAALSGLMGAGVGYGGQKLSKLIKPQAAVERLDDVAQKTGMRSLGFTKKLLNTELKEVQANEATRLARRRGLIKPFGDPNAMQEAAEGISKESGEAMGAFLKDQSSGATRALKAGSRPQLREQFLFDPKRSIGELESLRPKGLNLGDNADINRVIDKAVDTVKAKGTINARGEYALRPIPWEEARGLKTQIQGMANWDTAASNEVNNMKRSLGRKIRDSFMSQLEDAAESRGKGAGFDAFKQNVKNYGSAETLQDALQNRISSEKGNSIVGLRDLLAAMGVSSGTGSVGAGATVGVGFKLARKYGNQTISWSADKLMSAIQNNPQLFQKWMPSLQNAMQRGAQNVAVTSFVLQQSDPDYANALEEAGK